MAVKGGDKLATFLEGVVAKIGKAKMLRVGFVDGATYPDGTNVAQVAFWNEYGAKVNVAAHQTTVYRSMKKNGDFNKNGRFVRRSQANFASTHDVPAHTITIPARPFMRLTISERSENWGVLLGKLAVRNNFDMDKTMGLMGEQITGDIQKTIRTFNDPPNAKSTIAKKGKDNPLIDTGTMIRSVGYDFEG